jgi:hypothetical protein
VSYVQWLELITLQKDLITDLYASDTKIIVVPTNDQGTTGQVVHISTFTGTQKGLGKFSADCMGNFRVGLDANGKMKIVDINGIAAISAVR